MRWHLIFSDAALPLPDTPATSVAPRLSSRHSHHERGCLRKLPCRSLTNYFGVREAPPPSPPPTLPPGALTDLPSSQVRAWAQTYLLTQLDKRACLHLMWWPRVSNACDKVFRRTAALLRRGKEARGSRAPARCDSTSHLLTAAIFSSAPGPCSQPAACQAAINSASTAAFSLLRFPATTKPEPPLCRQVLAMAGLRASRPPLRPD